MVLRVFLKSKVFSLACAHRKLCYRRLAISSCWGADPRGGGTRRFFSQIRIDASRGGPKDDAISSIRQLKIIEIYNFEQENHRQHHIQKTVLRKIYDQRQVQENCDECDVRAGGTNERDSRLSIFGNVKSDQGVCHCHLSAVFIFKIKTNNIFSSSLPAKYKFSVHMVRHSSSAV